MDNDIANTSTDKERVSDIECTIITVKERNRCVVNGQHHAFQISPQVVHHKYCVLCSPVDEFLTIQEWDIIKNLTIVNHIEN